MAEVIIMPKLGFNMSEGKLVTWYKKEGDSVKKGEVLFAIETDKTNMDIEAVNDGQVRHLLIEEGETIPVTLPIAILSEPGEDVSAALKQALAELGKEGGAAASAAPAPSAQAAPATATAAPAAPATGQAYDFDIIVIGGGPGGYVAAIKASQMGKKVALVEADKLGGTCLNVGCIPTKALLKSIEVMHTVKDSEKFGVVLPAAKTATIDMKKVQERKAQIVSQLVGGVGGLLKGNKVTVIQGEGKLVSAHEVKVADKSYSCADVIIATGSDVKSLPIPVSKKMKMFTSKEILDIVDIPKTIAIIGGGVIGMEFAYFLAQAGSKVTVIEFLDRIMPMVDGEITDMVTKKLTAEGLEIYTSAKVTEVKDKSVVFEKDGATKEVAADAVLMAVGRAPSLKGIDCEALGLKTERGAIVTDECLRTSLPNVYAIGDVNGKAMLAHVASAEGIVAVETICGHKAKMDYGTVPSAIYIHPEIACVGLTEAEAKAKYKNIKVGKFPMLANGKAKVEGDETGIMKVITDATYGEILGVHMYCVDATNMISEAVVAMDLEATAEEVTKSIHPHPTLSEALHEAMHGAASKTIHFM